MSNTMVRRWNKINFVSLMTECLVTFSILVMALCINGDWLVILVHITKQFGIWNDAKFDRNVLEEMLSSLYLKDLQYFWLFAMLTGYGIYFLIGGFLHWYYYVRQKDSPETWKCQPKRWLSRKLEADEIKAGSVSLMVTNTWSALISCYIYNGGYSSIYYNWNEYGVLWLILQIPIVFIYQDYMTYWLHRIFHLPYLYRNFHKTHHKYVQPTAFSATAIHPVEITCIQMVLLVPLFVIPVHWVSIEVIAIYTYYHGITTHSGITFKAQWWQPWQPDSIFHDNHHQYYHVNFGFNFEIWDKIHNTYRMPDRVYSEKIFYGHGKPITEINDDELEEEIKERRTESITAFRGNKNPYLAESLRRRNMNSDSKTTTNNWKKSYQVSSARKSIGTRMKKVKKRNL